MRTVGIIVVGVLAAIGVLSLSLWIVTWYQFIDVCEHQALARIVSPSGSLAAEHYRRRCDDGRPDEYNLEIGTAWRGNESSSAQATLRSDVTRNEDAGLSMQPLRMWWLSETKLHIDVPLHDSIRLPSELGGIMIDSQLSR